MTDRQARRQALQSRSALSVVVFCFERENADGNKWHAGFGPDRRDRRYRRPHHYSPHAGTQAQELEIAQEVLEVFR
jgi:hypothetical protein